MRALVVVFSLLLACASPGPSTGTKSRPPTVADLCEGERSGALDFLRSTRVAPLYPREAINAGVTGWVEVEGEIGSNGEVLEPRVTQSQPPGVFDKAALDAFRQWRYCPAAGNGQPRVVKTRLHFSL